MKESKKKGKEMEERPSYYLPVKHSNRRRAAWHDYCSKSLYMLTYTCLPHRPLLSHIKLVNGKPCAVNTPLGNIILQEIENIPRFHPQIDIYTKIAMPDHIHFILYVKERLKHPLGMELAGFSKACNNAYRKLRAAGHDHKLCPPGNNRRNITDGTDSQLNAATADLQLFHEGFKERFKPCGKEFDLCCSGRLLLLAPWPDNLRRAVVTRAEAMAMNALASKIAVLEYSCPMSLL